MKCDMEMKYTDCEGIQLHIENNDMTWKCYRA